MTVGQGIRVPLVIEGTSRGFAPATVVYIHPKGRFYTARIELPGGSFHECFRLSGWTADGKDMT